MVGGLKESSGTKGDSAEVALALCDNNEEKVHIITHDCSLVPRLSSARVKF